jgi:glutamate racemase
VPHHKHRPIGVFDSGIGGLTVAGAISRLMPHESLIYFGDTAHMPYGDKSPESIQHYSVEIARFLIQKGCKAIVIACNTASALGYQAVTEAFGDKLPVINVIEPVAKYVSINFPKRKIGVIGTKGTINSRIYPRIIKKHNKTVQVASLATPLLAPMVEEGFYNNNISQTIINSYLSKKNLKDIDAIILGCTHYPLIKFEIKRFYGKSVDIVDSAEVVAAYLSNQLNQLGLNADANKVVNHQFFVSDYTVAFERSTRIFFKQTVHLQEERLWD